MQHLHGCLGRPRYRVYLLFFIAGSFIYLFVHPLTSLRFGHHCSSSDAVAFFALPFTPSAPWISIAAPGYDGPVDGVQDAMAKAERRVRDVIDSRVAGLLYDSAAEYGGLVVLRGMVGERLTSQMHCEAESWRQQGLLEQTGQERDGRDDTMRFLGASEATTEGTPGITYGIMLLCNLCRELNRHRPSSAPLLEPGPVQLSCYDGVGKRYVAHRDSRSFSDLGSHIPELTRQEIAARRVTAVLYLQTKWEAEWGGAFRGHRAAVDEGEPASDFVDVEPGEGSLVLFRSCDLAHEVLPCKRRRFALSMWCLDADE